ncbi:MAG: rRNA maturation RNase YbeY [Actinomycetota bacterium]
MLEIEVIGQEEVAHLIVLAEIERLALIAAASANLSEGHLAIEFVDCARIRELNYEHRNLDEATDVLSFPIDEDATTAGPRELGDVVICPSETADLREAVVHGVLHLTGMDHETDDGEMLAVQREILGW